MTTNDTQDHPSIQLTWLRPYASALIIRCTADDRVNAFEQLLKFMRNPQTRRIKNPPEIIASGIDIAGLSPTDSISQIDGFIYQRISPPSWATHDVPYRDIKNYLAVTLRRNDLIAIHCDNTLRESLRRWLDRSPRPPFLRVPPEILQGAFLQGEAKGLWLRGTHARRTTRPDSKNMSGGKLQDALNPFEDSSFAMGSARAAMPIHSSRNFLKGTVGTTPRKALIWNKPVSDFQEYVSVMVEALALIEETAYSDLGVTQPFPILATEWTDLSVISGAYDISVLSSEDLPAIMDASDEVLNAADVLSEATLTIHGSSSSADFSLDVGLNNSVGGTLQATVQAANNGIELDFGFAREPTDLFSARVVLDALNAGRDLLTIYYDSGHMFDGQSIWIREFKTSTFEAWKFLDFSGFDITKEKPPGNAQQIHDAIGGEDKSLFSWTLKHYSSGWLTCDDGAGEVADFVHIAPDGTLSLIHVKKANSPSLNRGIAVGAYEVVASQAAKNIINLERDSLRARLSRAPVPVPATWTDGERVEGREDFLEALECRGAKDQMRIVVIQPHVSEPHYEATRRRSESTNPGDDYYRLNLLETLLNSIRGSIIASNADLIVVGSKE